MPTLHCSQIVSFFFPLSLAVRGTFSANDAVAIDGPALRVWGNFPNYHIFLSLAVRGTFSASDALTDLRLTYGATSLNSFLFFNRWQFVVHLAPLTR